MTKGPADTDGLPAGDTRKTDSSGSSLKTLERGIDVLELLASEGPLSNSRAAALLGLHRSIAYRVLRTLESRGLAQRDSHGRYALGLELAVLGNAVKRDLQSAALPELRKLSETTFCTAFIVVAVGADAITLTSVQPRHADGHVLAYRPSARHPLDHGAPGLAALAAMPARPGEREEVTVARERGYVRTTSEITAGLSSLAAPLSFADSSAASIAIVFVAGHLDEPLAIEHLLGAAARITAVGSVN